jgi:hypothetical protein
MLRSLVGLATIVFLVALIIGLVMVLRGQREGWSVGAIALGGLALMYWIDLRFERDLQRRIAVRD